MHTASMASACLQEWLIIGASISQYAAMFYSNIRMSSMKSIFVIHPAITENTEASYKILLKSGIIFESVTCKLHLLWSNFWKNIFIYAKSENQNLEKWVKFGCLRAVIYPIFCIARLKYSNWTVTDSILPIEEKVQNEIL